MPKFENRTKVAAQCRDCGAVYSAWVLSDNTVHPIGKKNGCRCGGTSFRALSDTSDHDSRSSSDGN